MKLILYELKKLCGIGYLWILIAAMALGCGWTFYYRYKDSVPEERKDAKLAEVQQLGRELANEYGRDSDYLLGLLDEAYEYRNEKSAAKHVLTQKFIDGEMTDEEYEAAVGEFEKTYPPYENKLGYHYRDGEPISDYDVLRVWISSFTLKDEYEEYIKGIVSTTEKNLRRIELRGGAGTPAYEYQEHFYELYKNAQTINIDGITPSAGWECFLSFDMISVFIYAFLILAAGIVYLHERSCGTLLLIRTSKRGKLATALSKLAAIFVLDVFVVFVFTLAVFLVFVYMFGYSSPSVAIQALRFELYWSCPYKISIGGFALVMFGVRTLLAFAFSCVTAAVASLSMSPVLTYAAGAVTLVLNMVINNCMTYDNKIKLNLIGMSSSDVMFEYSEIFINGHYYPTFYVGLVIFALIAAVFAAVAVAAGMRQHASPTVPGSRLSRRIRDFASGIVGRLPAKSDGRGDAAP